MQAWPRLTYATGRHAILVLGVAVTTFFLVFGRYDFPGGAYQFIDWANVIVAGGSLSSDVAQRDIGYPLLLILGGYPFFKSFVGITLINAAFAVLIPLLVYGIVGKERPATAFWASLAVIASGAPYVFVKFIHHDHAYLFFTVATLYFGVTFLRRQSYRYLYFMTLAAILASLTRPTGNLFFIAAIGFTVIALPSRLYHYALCVLLFAVAVGAYAIDRHRLGFDDPTISYTGRQLFYGPYINSRSFGVQIGPELGPATARLISSLRSGLAEHPVDSPFFQEWLSGQRIPPATRDRLFQDRTVDDLVELVLTHPRYDLFELLCLFERDDRVFRDAAIEIVGRHPFYFAGYTIRNLILFFGTDGFVHFRYAPEDKGLAWEGLYFGPLFGKVVQADSIPPPGIEELKRDPLGGTPRLLSWAYGLFKIWHAGFLLLMGFSFALGLAGVVGAYFMNRDARIVCWFSGLLALYNALIVCAFADPASRYHYAILPEQFICAAFGVLVLLQFVSSRRPGTVGEARFERGP